MSEEQLKTAPDSAPVVDSADTTDSVPEDPQGGAGTLMVSAPENSAYTPDVANELREREADLTGGPKLVDTEFSITSHLDPQRQKSAGGVYWDDLQRQKQELNRAAAAGESPDFSNLQPAPGEQVIQTAVAKQQFPDSVPLVAFTQPIMVGHPDNGPAEESDDSENYRTDEESEPTKVDDSELEKL